MTLHDYRAELRRSIIIEAIEVDDETVDVAGIAPPLAWARMSLKDTIISAAGRVIEERYAHCRPTYDPGRRPGNLGTIIRMPRADLLPEDAAAVHLDWQTRHSWLTGTVEKVRRFQGGKIWDLQLTTPDGPFIARCEPAKHPAIGDDPDALKGVEFTVYGHWGNPSDSSIIRLHSLCVVRGRVNLEDRTAVQARRYAACTLSSQIYFLPRAHRDIFEATLTRDPAMLWALHHSFAYTERIPGGDVKPPLPCALEACELAESIVLDRLPVETLAAFAKCLGHPKAPPWCASWAVAAQARIIPLDLTIEESAQPAEPQAVVQERML